MNHAIPSRIAAKCRSKIPASPGPSATDAGKNIKQKSRAEARESIEAALEAFETIGAAGWAAKARAGC